MAREFGLVKNVSSAIQFWGPHEIAPGTIGRVPVEVVESLRNNPLREFVVVEDNPKLCPFIRTPHRPFSARYR